MENCQSNNSLQLSYDAALGALYSTHEKWLLLGVIPLLMIVGIIGNLGFLFVLFKMEYMKSITNFYLGNLAVTDLAFIIIMAIRSWWFYVNSEVEFDVPYISSLVCAMFNLVFCIFRFSSFTFVTLVIVERYLAICKPLYHRIVSGEVRSVKLAIATWLIAVVFAAIYTMTLSSLKYVCVDWPENEIFASLPSKISVCTTDHQWMVPLNYYIQAIAFWSALFLNTIMSYSIIMTLHRRKPLTETNSGNKTKPTKDTTITTRNQVAKMLIVNNIAFFLLAGPFHIRNIILIIEYHIGFRLVGYVQSSMWYWVGNVAAVANSVVNPIIYNVTNPRYRAAFAKAFGCANSTGRLGNNVSTNSLQMSSISANHN
ncbi:neuromedin-U receptor 2-like [Amphiura filiformis]|uniref:neuromedin-U receptor 2-like n=1 Tax=Amphiura filiformis TaxID=82378 RepID=UPI003B220177